MMEEESASVIIGKIVEFAGTSELNRMPAQKRKMNIFDEPVVRFADGDDPVFTELKTIIAPTHMTPREVLAQACDVNIDQLPDRISVISWILPITAKTRKSNRKEDTTPSRLWSHTRWFGEKLNEALREHVVNVLTDMGYHAVAPATRPYLKLSSNDKGPYSNWSERHVAYVAGQGSFSLSDGFITDRGIAHRCGSVVTDLALPASLRIARGPYANCLFYFDGHCKKCIKRCPAGAITEQGHDKNKCSAYLNKLGYSPEKMQGGYDMEKSVSGCGLCQTGTPCEQRIPRRIQKSRS